jgi:O-acetyl-ADP-ribose deacetylase
LRGGTECEADLLAFCYRRSIEAGREFESVAFPAISTGVYGFPAPQAAAIAVAATKPALGERPSALRRLIFCCYAESSAEMYRAALLAATGR